MDEHRLKELDGVRGVAVLMVMTAHIFSQAEVFWKNGLTEFFSLATAMGLTGVDFFFVLSGFLITSILLKNKGQQHYFRNFYARRSLRIFPVYYFCITIIFIGYFVFGNASIQTVFSTGFWFYSYLHNWIYAINAAPGLYFSHLWSLAIEEQFYLTWPLVIFFVDRKYLFQIGTGVILLALAVRIFVVFGLGNLDIINTFPYYSTITRIDSLMVGALIAVAFQTDTLKQQLAKDAPKLLLMFFVVVGACVAVQPASPIWNNRSMLTIGLTVIALLAGALIILLQTQEENHPARRFFRLPSLLFFGKYSYALYLFHWPIASLLITLYGKSNATGWPVWLSFLIIFYGGTILAALLSWNLLEKHALKLKRHFENKI
jgi:peptidoglycan/LPS O-acetylase OafA/YrhL